jgi:hypothetical protein
LPSRSLRSTNQAYCFLLFGGVSANQSPIGAITTDQ